MNSKNIPITVIFLCLADALLHLYALGSGPIQLDEGYTIFIARAGFFAPFRLGPCDSNPPMSFMPYAAWISVFGSSRWAVELFSVIFMAASLPLFYLLGRELYSEEVGSRVVVLAALSKLCLMFSQYIRIYSFAIFCSLLSVWLFLRYVRLRSGANALLFIAVAIVTVNLHYYAALAVFSLLLGFLFSKENRSAAFSALFLLGLLFLPTLIWQAQIIRVFHNHTWIEPLDASGFASIWYHFSSESRPLLICFATLCIVGTRRGLREAQSRAATLVLLAWLFLPILISAIFSLTGASIFHVRYFVLCLAPFLLLCSYGWALLPSLRVQYVLGAIICLLSIPPLYDYFRWANSLERDSEIYERLAAAYRPGDIVEHTSKCSFVSSSYAHNFQFAEYLPPSVPASTLKCLQGGRGKADLPQSKTASRLWVVDVDCFPDHRRTFVSPGEGFSLEKRESYPNGELYLFLPTGQPIGSSQNQ